MSRSFNGAEIVYESGLTASLANGASIQSDYIDLSQFSKYTWTVLCDAGNALTLMQESYDDVAQTPLSNTINYGASRLFNFSAYPRNKFIRFTATNNSGSAVTNVTVIIKAFRGAEQQNAAFAIDDDPLPFTIAPITKAVLSGKDTDGNYQNVQINQAGALLNSDFGLEVSRGLYNGYLVNTKFGRNSEINTSTVPEDMWNGGSTYTGFNATANENLETFSASANDTGSLITSGTATGGSLTTIEDGLAAFITDGVVVGDVILNDTQSIHGHVTEVTSETVLTIKSWSDGALVNLAAASGDEYRIARSTGTGAGIVKWIQPLNADYEFQTSPYVIMNGTTPVVTTGDFYRLSRGRVIKAGSVGKNAGAITARQQTTTANVFAVMPTFGQTSIGAFTVPKGKLCVIKRIAASIIRASGAAGSATITLNDRESGGAFNAKRIYELQTGSRLNEVFVGGITIRPRSDVKFTINDVSDNGTIATAEAEYYFIDES